MHCNTSLWLWIEAILWVSFSEESWKLEDLESLHKNTSAVLCKQQSTTEVLGGKGEQGDGVQTHQGDLCLPKGASVKAVGLIWTGFTCEVPLQGGCVSYQELLRSGRGEASQPGNGCCSWAKAKGSGDFNRGLQLGNLP